MIERMSSELDPEVHDQITALAEAGDARATVGDYVGAVKQYNAAWRLVPEPKNDWAAATWLLAAIGDCSYQAGYLTSARKALEYAMTCPGGVGNPFLHLRLGEVYYNQNELDAAADELTRAYMSEGLGMFASEDTKYLAFLRTRITIDSAPER